MANEEIKKGLFDESLPQWKKDLILRRRALSRALPAASGSVELTCPSAVAAVRNPEQSPAADFHLRRCLSQREQSVCKNMRLVQHLGASGDCVEPALVPEIKELMTKIEANSIKKMGEDKKKKRSGVGDGQHAGDLLDEDVHSDSSEEFKYGPGIVSRLKSRYLSLTLRESQGKVRPSLASMRRATSLENILDGPEPEKIEEPKPKFVKNTSPTINGIANTRCRGTTRGSKDSMKRARSVEALMRYERAAGVLSNNRRSLDVYEEVDGELKVAPTRISTGLEEKEMPPPDVVKQTLKIFEGSSTNRTPTSPMMKGSASPKPLGAGEPPSRKPAILPKPVLSNDKMSNGAETDKRITPPFKDRGNSFPSDSTASQNSLEKKTKHSNSLDHLLNKAKSQETRNKQEREDSAVGKSATSSNAVDSSLASPKSPKEKFNKSVINEKPLVDVEAGGAEVSPRGVQVPEGDQIAKPFNLKTGPSKPIMTLDLIETTASVKPFQSKSPASPKSADKKLTESPDLLAGSPVARAPSVAPSELTPQHMKQVCVIRPMVTNKSKRAGGKHSPSKSHAALTDREIEKNLINKVKSIEQPVTKVIVSLKKSPEECNVASARPEEAGPALQQPPVSWDKKPNTVVFNFSDRKTVPDYIENDGLILTSRKDKFKRGEPGFITLGGGTDDSSTDFDAEDLTYETTLPANYSFVGDNILINGRSNLRKKSKQSKLKVQFNDDATSLFEYPSEMSLLEDPSAAEHAPAPAESPAGLAAMPLRGSALASYTPSKVPMSSDFQLGVTKTAPPQRVVPSQPDTWAAVDDDYLRPADDSDTVTWSSEQADDLLF